MSYRIKIAVIIAAYNAELYIERCINSIQAQTYENWIAYIVNDGSADLTENILAEIAAGDNRIIYTTTKNKGVFCARRTAINMVQDCQYLTFIDSDDYLCDNEIFAKCIKKMLAENIDYLHFNYRCGKRNGFKEGEEQCWTEKREKIKNLLNNRFIDGNMPYAICQTDIAKKYFKVYSYNNDDFFNKYKMLIYSKKVAYVPWCAYCYYHNSESQTHRDIREIDYLYYVHAKKFAKGILNKYPELKKECDYFRCRVLLWTVHKLESSGKFKLYAMYKPVMREFRKNIIIYLSNRYFTTKERVSALLALIHLYNVCYRLYCYISNDR